MIGRFAPDWVAAFIRNRQNVSVLRLHGLLREVSNVHLRLIDQTARVVGGVGFAANFFMSRVCGRVSVLSPRPVVMVPWFSLRLESANLLIVPTQ